MTTPRVDITIQQTTIGVESNGELTITIRARINHNETIKYGLAGIVRELMLSFYTRHFYEGMEWITDQLRQEIKEGKP
jgi:hypothetical protein